MTYDEIEDLYENIKSEQATDNNLELDFYNNLLDDELSTALSKLPRKMKEVFLLCDLEGYSYEEIAEIAEYSNWYCPFTSSQSAKIFTGRIIRLRKSKWLLKLKTIN